MQFLATTKMHLFRRSDQGDSQKFVLGGGINLK